MSNGQKYRNTRVGEQTRFKIFGFQLPSRRPASLGYETLPRSALREGPKKDRRISWGNFRDSGKRHLMSISVSY